MALGNDAGHRVDPALPRPRKESGRRREYGCVGDLYGSLPNAGRVRGGDPRRYRIQGELVRWVGAPLATTVTVTSVLPVTSPGAYASSTASVRHGTAGHLRRSACFGEWYNRAAPRGLPRSSHARWQSGDVPQASRSLSAFMITRRNPRPTLGRCSVRAYRFS
jgi:hypothetical protein